MRFRRLNESRLLQRDFMRIEIRYFEDGGREIKTECREDGKWKPISTCYDSETPTWEKLHKCDYIGRGNSCFQVPEPLAAVVAHMKYTRHCMDIERDRAKKK